MLWGNSVFYIFVFIFLYTMEVNGTHKLFGYLQSFLKISSC